MNKYIREIIRHPLFSGSAVMVIGSNSVNVLNYLYHFLLGKLLGPSSYGELVALISLIGLLGIIPGSLSLVIVKYVSAAKKEHDTIILLNWLKDRVLKVALILCILITFVSPVIVGFLNISSVWYVILIAISFLFSLPTLINRSVLQGLLKFKEMIMSVFSENSIKLILGVFLVYLGFGVSGALLGFVIAVIIGWYMSEIFLKIPRKNKTDQTINLKSMVLFTLPVGIQSFAITSLYSSDIILVKHFFSSHDAGIYAALSTLGKIIFFGAGPIGAVMFPLISKRQSQGENYKKVFYYSFFATLLFSTFLLFIYWLIPSTIINMLYNSSYLEAKNLLFWFGLFITLFTLSTLLVNYNLSLGKTKVVLFPLIAAILQILLIWFYHQTLLAVIVISICVVALLLIILLVYSNLTKEIPLWR